MSPRAESLTEHAAPLETAPSSAPDAVIRVVLGLPGTAAEETALLERAGMKVLAMAADGPALLGAVRAHRPDVVLLHTHLPHVNARHPATFQALCRAVTILLVPASLRTTEGHESLPRLHQPYPPALLAEAERVGCPFVAAWPPEIDELSMLASQAVILSRHAAAGALYGASGAGGMPGLAPPQGRLIVIRGDKGGVGKSELAVNLACAFGLRGGRRVLLVDLDLTGPTLHHMLGLPADPARGLEALHARLRGLPAGERPDLWPFVSFYPPGEQDAAPRLALLAGPEDPRAADLLGHDPEALRALVGAARGAFDDIVVDLGADVAGPVHLLLPSLADVVLVVTDPTPEAVERAAAGHARLLNRAEVDPAACRLVVNRVADLRAELDLAQIRQRFGGLPLVGLLPEETRLVRQSRSAGIPWSVAADRRIRTGQLARALDALANHLVPGLFPPPPPSTLQRVAAALGRLLETPAPRQRQVGQQRGAGGLSGLPPLPGNRGTPGPDAIGEARDGAGRKGGR